MKKDLMIELIQRSKNGLVDTFKAVPEDKLTWKPLDNGRSVLDLFIEATNTCIMGEQFARTRGASNPNYEQYKELQAKSANWSREEALAALETSFTALLEAVDTLTDEELDAPYTMNFGREMVASFGAWAMMPQRTFLSRFAQINYIQTLYGDFDMH